MAWNFFKYGYQKWQEFFQRTGQVAPPKEEKHETHDRPKTPVKPVDDVTIGPK